MKINSKLILGILIALLLLPIRIILVTFMMFGYISDNIIEWMDNLEDKLQ